jgi:hypothetical protein
MFFGKKEQPQIVGAAAKREKAAALMSGVDPNAIKSRREGGKEGILPYVIAIWGMAVMLGLLLGMNYLPKNGAPFHLPDPLLDSWLLGARPPAVSGDKDMNLLIAAMARGTAMFVLAGIVPGLAWLWARMTRKDKPPMMTDFWLALLALLAAGLLLHAFKIV